MGGPSGMGRGWLLNPTKSLALPEARGFWISLFLGFGALLALGLSYFRGPTEGSLVLSLGLSFVVAAALCDTFWGIIPNVLVLAGLGGVLLVSWVAPGLNGLSALLGALLGGGLLFLLGLTLSWILKREALGGGDVKLMALIGATLGWEKVFPVLFWAAVLALTWAVARFLIRNESLRRSVRFGPWMGAATVLAAIGI